MGHPLNKLELQWPLMALIQCIATRLPLLLRYQEIKTILLTYAGSWSRRSERTITTISMKESQRCCWRPSMMITRDSKFSRTLNTTLRSSQDMTTAKWWLNSLKRREGIKRRISASKSECRDTSSDLPLTRSRIASWDSWLLSESKTMKRRKRMLSKADPEPILKRTWEETMWVRCLRPRATLAEASHWVSSTSRRAETFSKKMRLSLRERKM